MSGWTRQLDQMLQRLFKWLDDYFPSSHGLTIVSDGLMGLRGWVQLQVDRRMPDHVSLANTTEFQTGMNKADRAKGGGGGKETPQFSGRAYPGAGGAEFFDTCSFWAYCYMKGQPCVW